MEILEKNKMRCQSPIIVVIVFLLSHTTNAQNLRPSEKDILTTL